MEIRLNFMVQRLYHLQDILIPLSKISSPSAQGESTLLGGPGVLALSSQALSREEAFFSLAGCLGSNEKEIGRASCRERVCQYV